jgi:hypothetical protein
MFHPKTYKQTFTDFLRYLQISVSRQAFPPAGCQPVRCYSLRAVFYDYQNTEKEEERSFHGKIPLPFL